jgi:hypothetical protein
MRAASSRDIRNVSQVVNSVRRFRPLIFYPSKLKSQVWETKNGQSKLPARAGRLTCHECQVLREYLLDKK